MDRYDYRSINIPKGAESGFNKVFASFGYKVLTAQEIFLSDSDEGTSYVNPDMAHFYLPGEEDEAMLGLTLHRADEPVKAYLHIVYERDRADERFRTWLDAEHIYNRATYDRYRLSLDIAKYKKRKWLPKAVNVLLWILLALGVIALLLGVWKKGMNYPVSDAFNGRKSSMAFYGGAAAIVLVLFIWIIHFAFFHAIADGKLKHALVSYDEITIMKNRFRADFRHLKTVPELDMAKLEDIEKANKITREKK